MTDDQAELRKLWRQYWKTYSATQAAWVELGSPYPPPNCAPLPDELRGLNCGATTRAGKPCKRRDLYGSGRCRLHGGLSTGPRRSNPTKG
ncbi:MAG TPA: HGGxSTG domain-containing protein [Pseudomonas sp.]|uniref:HGGxSTG domain-containing protein n=1 Tax=Pseudomonas sp. TaxID=306 RepID=UPI002C6A6AA7|nr:HGGxSTG domain-containing protein [Pseudomonas sp.]HRL92584.1 HGGxSTG domain-containing protein [Pseudomonas sp.]